MRVLLISWEYPPNVVGGIGTHVAELVAQLGGLKTSNGPIHADVLTSGQVGGEAVEKISKFVTVHRPQVPGTDAVDMYNSVVYNNGLLADHAATLCEKQPYDLIHVHDWLTATAGIRLKHLWKTPLIVTMHATEFGRHQGYLPTWTSFQIDQLEKSVTFEAWDVIACSQYMLNELNGHFTTPRDKIAVIPNGVTEPEPGNCAPDVLDGLRRLHAPDGESLLFYVGRIVHEKGVHLLVRAMPRILADYPNTRLLVAGKNSQKLYPLAYELGVEKNVEMLGFVTDAVRDCLYRIVDAAVFPSLYEPFGIVALETMASNCNVIASDTGGLREVVQHEVNGLSVIPGDALSIANQVGRLFSDPEAAARRRAVAMDQVRSIYRWDRIARQTADLYDRVYRSRQTTDW